MNFDAHEVTIRRSESGAKFVVTAESRTQLTAFAVSPKLLRDLAGQARRVLREHDAESAGREALGDTH